MTRDIRNNGEGFSKDIQVIEHRGACLAVRRETCKELGVSASGVLISTPLLVLIIHMCTMSIYYFGGVAHTLFIT